MKKNRLILVSFLSLALVFSGCKTWSNALKGGTIGTLAGAAVGAGAGKLLGNTAVGAIAGAAVGGTVGTLIGHKMDKQAAELEAQLGSNAAVERIGEGIKVTFESGILFATGKSVLSESSKTALTKFSGTLKEYMDTNVMIYGHTDNTGSDNINQPLSENRAAAVKDYLVAQGVAASRITIKGMGSTAPVATNDTEAGRAQNRRVEVAITANEEMLKKAQNGEL
ncbi:MAG TPA: OmpA family protein [Bacteroidales bacterium]|nr:OmpA family protein [Bacteroidales bacterium]